MEVTYESVLPSASSDNLLYSRAMTRENNPSDLTLLSTGDILTQGYTDGALEEPGICRASVKYLLLNIKLCLFSASQYVKVSMPLYRYLLLSPHTAPVSLVFRRENSMILSPQSLVLCPTFSRSHQVQLHRGYVGICFSGRSKSRLASESIHRQISSGMGTSDNMYCETTYYE
jgi:hypothetical protein